MFDPSLLSRQIDQELAPLFQATPARAAGGAGPEFPALRPSKAAPAPERSKLHLGYLGAMAAATLVGVAAGLTAPQVAELRGQGASETSTAASPGPGEAAPMLQMLSLADPSPQPALTPGSREDAAPQRQVGEEPAPPSGLPRPLTGRAAAVPAARPQPERAGSRTPRLAAIDPPRRPVAGLAQRLSQPALSPVAARSCGDPAARWDTRCPDPELAGAERAVEEAYRDARQAGVPTRDLSVDHQDWLLARSEAAELSRADLLDAYRSRIDDLRDMVEATRDVLPYGRR